MKAKVRDLTTEQREEICSKQESCFGCVISNGEDMCEFICFKDDLGEGTLNREVEVGDD